MFKIDTMKGHERMSTQDLLLAIGEAVKQGETDFEIKASGQHDIGGPLWHPEGKKLHFHVWNAGQRTGSMCLPGTEIVIEESTSADVGWLNAGGIITVKGDAGDTAGHCSSGGKIFIGGRGGTRTGSLMKHDPLYEEPELWILKNVGSFSFEFMGGGKAVVCGYDSAEFDSVLGERACVGMVGGTVYVRGPIGTHPADIICSALDEDDIAFLAGGMDEFLAHIERPELKAELTDWSQWHKLRPLTAAERKPKPAPDLHSFRLHEWVKGGIFSDVAHDDFAVHTTISHGLYRLRVPSWDNAAYAAPCEFNCPTGIPTQLRYKYIRNGELDKAIQLELDYTPFPGCVCGSVCPNPCMDACTRGTIDEPIQIGDLGYSSAFAKVEPPKEKTGKKIGIIGGGQLGRMMALSARYMGFRVGVLDPTPNCPTGQVADFQITAEYDDKTAIHDLAVQSDVLTYEFENVDAGAIDEVRGITATPQGTDLLRVTQHRVREKQFINDHGTATAPWRAVNNFDELDAALDEIHYPAVLKTVSGGYDGHGQLVLRSDADLEKIRSRSDRGGGFPPSILEGFVDFAFEASILVSGNGKDFVTPAALGDMSSAERSYFVVGNLAAAYHNGHNKDAAYVDGKTVMLGVQPIMTCTYDDESAQKLADRLNKIK